jgi:hypothetical protein
MRDKGKEKEGGKYSKMEKKDIKGEESRERERKMYRKIK